LKLYATLLAAWSPLAFDRWKRRLAHHITLLFFEQHFMAQFQGL